MRAVAVGGVIALHLGCPGSALGWTGVNLFFVLSGFLITGILLEDKGSQHYYATFYCRRSLRIFPIYYLTIATLAFAGIATGESISHLPYFATYTQNWLYALYDVHVQFPWGASHTWSLAIEEQFYLLWPLAVAMLPEQALLKLVVLIIILGNLSRDLVMHMTSQWGAGYAFQYDMLAWGALGAIIYRGNLLPQETLARLAKLGVVIGIATLVFVRLHYGPGDMGPWVWLSSRKGQLLFGGLGPFCLSIIILALLLTPLTNLLELRPIRYCGKISYGLYLYHWPLVVVISPLGFSSLTSGLLIASAALLIAATSYHFFEQPILRYKDRIAPRTLRPVQQAGGSDVKVAESAYILSGANFSGR